MNMTHIAFGRLCAYLFFFKLCKSHSSRVSHRVFPADTVNNANGFCAPAVLVYIGLYESRLTQQFVPSRPLLLLFHMMQNTQRPSVFIHLLMIFSSILFSQNIRQPQPHSMTLTNIREETNARRKISREHCTTKRLSHFHK